MNRISRELLSAAREIKDSDDKADGSGFQLMHDFSRLKRVHFSLPAFFPENFSTGEPPPRPG